MARNRGGRRNFRSGRGGDRGFGSRNKQGWSSQPRSRDDRVGQSSIERSNQKFEKYYNDIGIIQDGDEREQFWATMRADLPNSFRFAGSKGHALTVQQRLISHYIPQISGVEYEGQLVQPPEPISWFPDKLAWQMSTSKTVIRKFKPFASFQKFLVSETSVGNISRQEIVSMIPPLLLDVHPHMTVLDMCAAPGSKSAQLIEALHTGEEAKVRRVLERAAIDAGVDVSQLGPIGRDVQEDLEMTNNESEDNYADDGRPTGLLVANDREYKRAQMLVHQTKRLNSANIIVTNHDAILFPSLQLPSESGRKYIKFDRILADVPCSGDGTCRKNLNVWKDWGVANGLGLHIMQTRILVRALQMLKVGGRVVYSTCSLNPIENEAVVSSAIQRVGGIDKARLVDVSDSLPGLQRRPGLTTWQVMDKKGKWWKDWDHVLAENATIDDHSFTRLSEGMFPPSDSADIPLQRCVRVYPHLQDTGGFFIAVIEKQIELKTKPETKHDFKHDRGAEVKQEEAPTIVDVAKEIEEKGNDANVKLDTLDAYVNPLEQGQDQDDDMKGNVSAAARRNETVELSTPKRELELDEAADDGAPSKRTKVTEPPTNDRIVHWPPPPGAATDLTAHQHEAEQRQTNAAAYSNGVGTQEETAEAAAPQRANKDPHEEAYKYLPPNHPELQEIFQFYDLSERFPRDRFMVRNESGHPAKAIYYTSALARTILTNNEGKGIKFVHCGVKMFVKQDVQGRADACKWRIQTEGLPIIEPWVGEKRIVRCSDARVLRKLLIEMFPRLLNAQDAQKLGSVGERCLGLAMGCCVLRIEPASAGTDNDRAIGTDEESALSERIVLPLWRGASSVNLMLPKEERKAMLLRLFDDDSPLIDHSKERFAKSQQSGPNTAGDKTNGDGDEHTSSNQDGNAGGKFRHRSASNSSGTLSLTGPVGDENIGAVANSGNAAALDEAMDTAVEAAEDLRNARVQAAEDMLGDIDAVPSGLGAPVDADAGVAQLAQKRAAQKGDSDEGVDVDAVAGEGDVIGTGEGVEGRGDAVSRSV